MYKPVIAGVVIALGLQGWQPARSDGHTPQLKEEALILKYSATSGEAAVMVEAESEDTLNQVVLRDPAGARIHMLQAEHGRGLGVSGFMVETREARLTTLLEIYSEGIYDFRARTVDGEVAFGSAVLSHELPPAPVVTYPLEGDVNVPTTNLTVSWTPNAEAVGYRVILEQGENDGLVIQLPAGTSSFQVPDGFLAPATRTQVEVGAMGANGNTTLVEVRFRTL